MSTDDAWSACSEGEISDETTESESFDERAEVGTRSHINFKRLPKACKVASEDHSQLSG